MRNAVRLLSLWLSLVFAFVCGMLMAHLRGADLLLVAALVSWAGALSVVSLRIAMRHTDAPTDTKNLDSSGPQG